MAMVINMQIFVYFELSSVMHAFHNHHNDLSTLSSSLNQTCFWPGLSQTLLRALVDWEGEHNLPIPTLLTPSTSHSRHLCCVASQPDPLKCF